MNSAYNLIQRSLAMSVIETKKNGVGIGAAQQIFGARQLEMEMEPGQDKPIHVKLSPGTDLFNQVLLCANYYQVTPTKAARMMMKAGGLGFQRVLLLEARKVQG